eukprot:scaffold2163_cov78-Skeletonema_dohrnii-CCMP3373.AAC.1
MANYNGSLEAGHIHSVRYDVAVKEVLMERLLPNPFPFQSIHRSSSSPKIQLRLPGKGAAAALFMIGVAFIGGATNGGGSSNKEISILGQPASTVFIVASRCNNPS